MKRKDVYKAIDSERDYQDKRWNDETTASGGKHSPEGWLLYMQDYLTEAIHIASRNPYPQYLSQVMDNIRKITAMGVCAMEQHGVELRKN